ncbi:MAG: thioredoxin family protein [Planctomycetota bacterium]
MFRDLGLDDAKAAAEREGKLLFIHTTAVWCPPCKKMERETYRDADLQTYFEQNLVAIKIDVDDQPRDSRSLGVSSIPTMIAMADGTRLDDHTGFIGASDLMSWLQGVEQRAERSGLISAADATATATDSSGLPMDDVAGRMAHAAKLAADGNARDAASTYASLWTDMPEVDRNLSAYRLTVLASSMGDLAQTDPSARASFQSIFDSVDSQVRSRPDWDTYGEWLALNARVLEDDDAINTWVSEFAGSSRGLATIRRRHAVL